LLGQNVNSWQKSNETTKQRNKKTKYSEPTQQNQELPPSLAFGELRRAGRTQNYERDADTFAQLLRTLHDIEGLERISFLTANPFDFSDELVEALALPKIDRYLHMAVQSGSNQILQKMNRKHTIEDYKRLIARIRKVVPDIRLGTDIIVGFPGETDEDFAATMQLLREIEYVVVYVAMYSPRPGTAAVQRLRDDVLQEIKQKRHKTVLDYIRHTTRP
jgi:tRNA-2-methylthio-N6-dimethylallyladenosine synthase